MANKKLPVFLLAILAITGMAMAQPTMQKMQQKLVSLKQNTNQSFYRFEINTKAANQASLKFSADMALPKSNLQAWADRLPSNDVKGIAIYHRVGRILLATKSEIVFKNLLCKECVNIGPAYSVLPGNWVNPGIWAVGKVPGVNSNVIIKHPVVITSDANCNSLKLEGSGKITVNAGVKLNIEGLEYKASEW
jgi:hypothetical protein